MMLTPLSEGPLRGRRRQILYRQRQQAALVSTFGKNSETGDYVFFAVETDHENYECVKNVVNSQNYVAEYALHSYPITDDEILSTGRRLGTAR
jgi:acyl-CoA dehydrogenase